MAPATVPPLSVTVAPPTVVIKLPTPLDEKLALLMTAPLSSCTCEPLSASIAPPPLLMVVCSDKVPPSARSVPVLVTPAAALMSSPADDDAMIVPWLASAKPALPAPRVPAPVMVCALPKVSVEPAP